MRIYGYARVSTNQQCLQKQIDKLKEAGIEEHRILTDVMSGKESERQGLENLRIKVERGDKVVATRLDRLGRDTAHMVNLLKEFDEKGVAVQFLQEGLSTEGEMGTMLITILVAVAQAERNRILQRTHEGRVAAMEKGLKFGKPFTFDTEKALELHKTGMTATRIAEKLGVARGSIHSFLTSRGHRPNTKPTVPQDKVVAAWVSGKTQDEIAEEFNCSKSHISSILRKNGYKYLGRRKKYANHPGYLKLIKESR